MDDIVKELRESRGYDMSIGEARRAADEIERLRLCIRDGTPASVALDDAPTFAELIESEHRNPQTSETAVVAEELTKQADEIERLRAAIARSPYDISPCGRCGLPTVCLPDGLPLCKKCGEKAANEQ